MIERAEQFSPNSVEKDRAILEAVAERLRLRDCEVTTVSEVSLGTHMGADPLCFAGFGSHMGASHTGSDPLCFAGFAQEGQTPCAILSMARLPETLEWLKVQDARIINRPEGVENCRRSRLQAVMERIGVPTPPREGCDGYWLKRGDGAAQGKDDVVYCQDGEALQQAILVMEQRGISDYTVSAHVRGDVVKFYGVSPDFFRYYYPTDDGQTKFGDEQRNGAAHHYAFDVAGMQREAERLAAAVGVEVYGGDCIVRSDGSFCFIDFNDWPSFSRCRQEAADAIAERLRN